MRHSSQGSAIVLVLFFILAVSSLVAKLNVSSRSGQDLFRIYERRIKADLSIQLAQDHVRVAFQGENPALRRQLPENGTVYQTELNGTTFKISVSSESGKIDFTRAPLSQLEQLFEGLGFDREINEMSVRLSNYRRQSDRYGIGLYLDELAKGAAGHSINLYDYITLYSDQTRLSREHVNVNALEVFSNMPSLVFGGRQRSIYTISTAMMVDGAQMPGQDWVVSIKPFNQYEVIAKRYRLLPL